MPSDRLALALRELQPADWQLFERFASEFLAVEFPSLRTMASPAGDKGRDAQLFSPVEASTTACQYSVTQAWEAKIKATADRLASTMPDITRLIYCTNQVIGPAADDLVEAFRRNKGLSLDVRDRSWFVERELTAPQREVAAEELAKRVVDPLLSREGVIANTNTSLSEDDARIALLHLTLEGYDEDSNRNLTKSAFEALVLAALHGSDSDNLMSAADIHLSVERSLSARPTEQVGALVTAALKRLSTRNGPVKHVKKSDGYHLAFEEQQRRASATGHYLLQQRAVEDELGDSIGQLGLGLAEANQRELAVRLREGIEEVLVRRGEAFASAVSGGVMSQLDVDAVLELLTERGHNMEPLTREAAAEVIFSVLEGPSSSVQSHLARLADAYTLFAFLRQTPDVQKVVLTIFSGGEIWLDSTVVLPLLAETLLDELNDRHYTVLLQSAKDAGFKLYVTDGVVEEVERHLNRSLLFARTAANEWRSGVPFLYAAFAMAGLARGSFFDWLSEFRGELSPEEDVKEYLDEEFHIKVRNLAVEVEAAPLDLRAAVREVWAEAHERRRGRNEKAELLPEVTSRLVAHDVENSVGVMQLRKASARS